MVGEDSTRTSARMCGGPGLGRCLRWIPASDATLADVVQSKVEAAEMHSDLSGRCRPLMEDWASHLAGERREPEAGSTR